MNSFTEHNTREHLAHVLEETKNLVLAPGSTLARIEEALANSALLLRVLKSNEGGSNEEKQLHF